MLRAQTVDIICNDIKMRSLSRRKAYILVEGPDDSRLLRRFLSGTAEAVSCGSRENVIAVAEKLSTLPGLIGIIDSDGYFLIENRSYPANVFQTDSRDMEVSLFSLRNLEVILNDLASEAKMASWTARYGSPFDRMLDECKKVGGMVHLSNARSLELDFKDLRWKEFTDRDSLVVDVPRLIEYIKNKSQKRGLSSRELQEQLQSIIETTPANQIRRGHDLIAWIAFSLHTTLGSVGSIKEDVVALAFRLSVSRDQLSSLEMYRLIQVWCADHGLPGVFA